MVSENGHVAKYVCPYCGKSVPIKPNGNLLYHVNGGRICKGVRFVVPKSERPAKPPKTDWGTCPTCHRSVALKGDDYLRSHKDNSGRHCPDSGRKATKIVRAHGRKAKRRGGGRSVHALGGGLPGLGKRR